MKEIEYKHLKYGLSVGFVWKGNHYRWYFISIFDNLSDTILCFFSLAQLKKSSS